MSETMTTSNDVGVHFIDALARHEFDAAGAMLAPTIQFKALTPRKLIEAADRAAAMTTLTGWFDVEIDGVDVESGNAVGTRRGLGYQVRYRTADAIPKVFEQRAYYEVGPEGLLWLHLVCSGIHPA